MSDALISVFTQGFEAAAQDALTMVGIIVPVALGVAGVIFVARRAMRWFTSMIGR